MKVSLYYSYFPHGDPVDWETVMRRAAALGAESVELSARRLAEQEPSVSAECFAVPHNVWTNNMCLWREYVREGIDEDVAASISFLKGILEKLSLR